MIAQFLMSTRCARVLRLLEEERGLILSGPLSALGPLVERRERALAEITSSDTPPSLEFITALKARAERNSRLLLASLAGIRAARKDLEKLDEDAANLRTYTADGAHTSSEAQSHSRDLRA